ncbi:MAG: hypothetical protein ACPGWR_22205 [Ardenticatenaceae bacterium]
MVTDKSMSLLQLELVHTQKQKRVLSKRDRTGILGISPKLLLILKYYFFGVSLTKRLITAGTLVVKEEFLWFFKDS